jgi:hypothetical protein
MTDNERDELISAALDGERVDVMALQDALTTADGRASAAAFLLLRATVAADTSESPRSALAGVTEGRRRARFWPVLSMPRVPVGLAASIVLLAAAGAFWTGAAWREAGADTTAGPEITASRPAPSAPAAAQATPGQSISDRSDAPPAPSRVLRLTPGVDWHEGS